MNLPTTHAMGVLDSTFTENQRVQTDLPRNYILQVMEIFQVIPTYGLQDSYILWGWKLLDQLMVQLQLLVSGPVVWIPRIAENERDCELQATLESQTTGPQTNT